MLYLIKVEQSKVVWEEMAKNWPLLDFLVRSKNCAFLENLEHYKKTEHRVQLVLEHFVDFQDQNIVTSHSTVSQISTFPNCDILYITRKIIQY